MTTSSLADYYTFLKNDVNNSNMSLYKAQNLGFQLDDYWFLSKEVYIYREREREKLSYRSEI